MKRSFTKKDLYTGDIVETRNGEMGVVILEKDSIIWQAGGLDIFEEVYTDDLFVDGQQRDGDIFKVYHDPDGPIGFNKLFDLEPVFRRRNDKATKERSAELTEKHDRFKGCIKTVVLEPCFRKYYTIHINPSEDMDVDLHLSEAPSVTACGKLGIDRTFIPIPDTDNLFLLYNQYQEKLHLNNDEEEKNFGYHWCYGKNEPLFSVPEENIEILSRCMLIKKNDSADWIDFEEDDLEKVKKYLVHMEPREGKNKNIFY